MQLDFDGKASQSEALEQEAKLQMLSRVARTPNNIKSTASAQPPRKHKPHWATYTSWRACPISHLWAFACFPFS